MARAIQITFSAASTTAITSGQTLGAAGALVIDGPLLDAPGTQYGYRRALMDPGTLRPVTLTSTGTLSGVNVTISGYAKGVAVSETIPGPANNTVSTTALFDTVTSITTNGAIGTAMSVGTGTTGQTKWVLIDQHIAPTNVAVGVNITATANVTVQDTYDDVNAVASPQTIDHTGLAAITASAQAAYAAPVRYLRAVMNSSSGSGAFTLSVIQAGL